MTIRGAVTFPIYLFEGLQLESIALVAKIGQEKSVSLEISFSIQVKEGDAAPVFTGNLFVHAVIVMYLRFIFLCVENPIKTCFCFVIVIASCGFLEHFIFL